MDIEVIENFKNRQIKAKDIFTIKIIPKNQCYEFIKKYHYLKDAKFFCVYGYGLFNNKELVGCATYSNPQGISALKGWFGLTNDNQNILELSRLCMLPSLNGTNATSYLLGNSLRMLKQYNIDAVITLADSCRHIGSIYQICNFKYFGLTNSKTDFYTIDGKLNPRGKTKDIHGVWLPRTRKHRYCYILNKKLKVLYEECSHPIEKKKIVYNCCNGTNIVYDNRFNEWFSCPKCCGNMRKINNIRIIVYDDYNFLSYFKDIDNGTTYIIDINNLNEQIIKNNKFDCVLTAQTSQQKIKPYKQNINHMITYDFRNNPPNLWTNFKDDIVKTERQQNVN